MSNQSNGLRFDVYERVHLPDDVAAIDELEEIELVPRIQVIDQGDQAILRGQLLLSGIYRGQGGIGGPLTLEHWIPVEISLPMNRVSRLDDISIEIDNFDVDLLSARTLNITGVLSLRGITVESAEEHNNGQWADESFTAVHQRENFGQQGFISASEQYEVAQLAESHQHHYEAGTEGRHADEQVQEQHYITGHEELAQISEEERELFLASEQASQESWLHWNANQQPLHQPLHQPDSSLSDYESQQLLERTSEEVLLPNSELESEWELSRNDANLQVVEEVLQGEVVQQGEQEQGTKKQQEVQIAFAGKPTGASDEGQSNLGFRTLLQSSKREQAAREAVEQSKSVQQAEEAARANAVEEEIEWKRLFLSKQSEDNAFRKIKMCIVQREETLEQIALRYSLNPRELLIRNGLHESAVAEGQLLYIP
ncbi:LysM peptidoglycan-binding domain-containing protein [Paenibacillus sp. L3-i20]|uniref:LysM peptidoglycan-binding domain-containing protein n=1 Tax=Paenibacillus sp. L3-i20 TaxID=2905833 RepID=UPI001EDD5E6D|nr:LysM peptidoglycan-binding domain-containing protein [Paenibacillus sp. L3-i20]GKU75730.1 hypothetical protein L3i20_v201270 [Paenibacillus sp. L3-i20]